MDEVDGAGGISGLEPGIDLIGKFTCLGRV